MTPTEELLAAASKLRDIGTVRAVIAEKNEHGAVEHTIAVCSTDHTARTDVDSVNCCPDCEYVMGYDLGLADRVVALLRSAAPLVPLIERAAEDARRESEGPLARPAEVVASAYGLELAVARAVNAAVEVTP